jgi:hypothetical protein
MLSDYLSNFFFSDHRILERSCYLTPGQNDTCFKDDEGNGVCYCHSDLCNHGSASATASMVAVLFPLAAKVFLRRRENWLL